MNTTNPFSGRFSLFHLAVVTLAAACMACGAAPGTADENVDPSAGVAPTQQTPRVDDAGAPTPAPEDPTGELTGGPPAVAKDDLPPRPPLPQ